MIEFLIQLLRDNGIDYGFFRLVGYPLFRGLIGMSTSLILSVLLGFRIITLLYRKGLRDTSGDFLSLDVASKRGTPTAGGALIVLTTAISIVLWGDWYSPYTAVFLGGFVYLGLVGFIDDYQKARFKSSLSGLSQLGKTVLLLVFIVPFSLWFVKGACPVPPEVRTVIYLPFVKNPVVDLGVLGFLVFSSFVLFYIINDVNKSYWFDSFCRRPYEAWEDRSGLYRRKLYHRVI